MTIQKVKEFRVGQIFEYHGKDVEIVSFPTRTSICIRAVGPTSTKISVQRLRDYFKYCLEDIEDYEKRTQGPRVSDSFDDEPYARRCIRHQGHGSLGQR